jgi:hypothetical protein
MYIKPNTCDTSGMNRKQFKLSITSLIILAIVAIFFLLALYRIHKDAVAYKAEGLASAQAIAVLAAVPTAKTTTPATGSAAATTSPTTTSPAADAVNLPIPFTPQAPTGNWDELHNEACEEATSIMANAYLTGDREALIPAARVETEISGLTVWEDKHFGYHLDTTAAETAQMIEGYYGLKATVTQNYTLQNIKDQINLGHVVILPVNGRLIGNPYYKTPGPIYHMLVIRGYSGSKLITNDSGTKNGENYPYAFSTLYAAGADWDHSTNTIDQSKKVMIIVSK